MTATPRGAGRAAAQRVGQRGGQLIERFDGVRADDSVAVRRCRGHAACQWLVRRVLRP